MADPQLPGTMIVQDPWDQAFASYRQALVDLNGDGVPNVVIPTANTSRMSDRASMRQAGNAPVADPNGTGRLAERWTAAGVGAVDPFNATSWAVGKASPETGQWMRDVQARDPDAAMAGGVLTPFGAAIKGVGAVANAVRMNPMLAAGVAAGGTLATPTEAGDGQSSGPQFGDVRNFVGLRDFTPMDRDTFNTRFSEPMPQPPPSLQDYVTSAANAVREAGDPKRSPSATQRNVERAQAAAERQYPSIVSQYDKDLNAWNKRRQDAYTLYKNDLTKGREGYYNQPFSARAPMASIVAGYGIPAVAAAASYGKMRADRSRAVSGLTDEIASGSLSPSAEALKRNELTALKATVPQGIFGDIAERARYAAPGMALSSVERVGEDIVDRMATPADAGARQHVVDRYTDLSKLPGTVVDYALRAGLPFAMTGVAGFGPAIKPQVAARSDAVLNDGGRAIAAGDISQSRGLLRSIDEDAALRSRLADEAARQEQAVLEELAAAGPTPEVRQRVTNALAQRGQTQLPSQPFQPSLEAASNRALPSPNAMLSDTPQPRQNQGFSLSPPPNGGPAVRDPMPIIAVDQTIPDPRQLSMDLSFKEGLRELPSTYRPIVEREFRAAMSDPVKRQIITSGNFADQLTRAFAEAGLPPIPPAELVQRIENLFQGTRSVNRTMMNTRPRSDGTPRFHVGQTNVQDAMFGTNGPHQSGLWDPRFTFGIAGAAASGPVLNPMLQQYYGD